MRVLINIVLIFLACSGYVWGIDEFMDVNAQFIDNYVSQHSNAVRLPSGLLYRVLKEGPEGSPHVSVDQLCSVRYVGTNIHGAVFMSSRKKGQVASEVLAADSPLAGLKEALSLMREGDHWEVVIPAHLGYGGFSMGEHVKPSSTLVLDLKVDSAAASAGMSLLSRQALGLAFLVVYAGYTYYEGKQKMGPANAAPSLQPGDLRGRAGNAVVFLQVAVGSEILPRMEIELFSSTCPKTAENFRCLCTGEKGMCKEASQSNQDVPLHLKGSVFHRVIPGFMCQGGDITRRDGTGGESIYGTSFPDEWEHGAVLHSEPFLLSMANCGVDTNSSQFFITTKAASWLDRKHVVFGCVRSGFDSVKAMEAAGSASGHTSKFVRVIDCGEIKSSSSKSD